MTNQNNKDFTGHLIGSIILTVPVPVVFILLSTNLFTYGSKSNPTAGYYLLLFLAPILLITFFIISIVLLKTTKQKPYWIPFFVNLTCFFVGLALMFS